jgi:hypothetical protein
VTAAFIERCEKLTAARLQLAYKYTALATEAWSLALDDVESNDIERRKWREEMRKLVKVHRRWQHRLATFRLYMNWRREQERRGRTAS